MRKRPSEEDGSRCAARNTVNLCGGDFVIWMPPDVKGPTDCRGITRSYFGSAIRRVCAVSGRIPPAQMRAPYEGRRWRRWKKAADLREVEAKLGFYGEDFVTGARSSCSPERASGIIRCRWRFLRNEGRQELDGARGIMHPAIEPAAIVLKCEIRTRRRFSGICEEQESRATLEKFGFVILTPGQKVPRTNRYGRFLFKRSSWRLMSPQS